MFDLIFITLIKNKNSCLSFMTTKIRLITPPLYFSEVTSVTHYTCMIDCSLNTDKIDDLQAHTHKNYFSQTSMSSMTLSDTTIKLLLLLSNCLNILKVYQIIIRFAESQKLSLVWQGQIFMLLTLHHMYVQALL